MTCLIKWVCVSLKCPLSISEFSGSYKLQMKIIKQSICDINVNEDQFIVCHYQSLNWVFVAFIECHKV